MGKRVFQERFQEFKRAARDFYPTPAAAAEPLIPFLCDELFSWCEPCVGDGSLASHLMMRLPSPMVYACDLCPTGPARGYAEERDCLGLTLADCERKRIGLFITNPPWPAKMRRGSGLKRGEPTTTIIRHLSGLRPAWFLLSADIAHNDYLSELLDYCTHIVSVGRVKWITGSSNSGVDNAAWYRFDRRRPKTVPRFYGRGNWFERAIF